MVMISEAERDRVANESEKQISYEFSFLPHLA